MPMSKCVESRLDKIKLLSKISKGKKDNKSNVPNPIRTNFDYGEDGYNFLDKIRKRLKERKKREERAKKKSSNHPGGITKEALRVADLEDDIKKLKKDIKIIKSKLGIPL
jgi:hypothetical protein